MSIKEHQAPNKQNEDNALQAALKAAKIVEGIRTSAIQVEKNYNEKILKCQGFVSVVANDKETDVSKLKVAGLLVLGGRGVRETNPYRNVRVNGASPRWFKDAVLNEAKNPTGMMFRVRIVGLSDSGKVAYVAPCARDLENAKAEDRRRVQEQQRMLANDDMLVEERVVHKAYAIYAAEHDMIIDTNYSFPDSDEVVMVSKKAIPDVYIVSGAMKITTFTDGIRSGYTTWQKEIARSVVAKRVDPYHNNLMKAIA